MKNLFCTCLLISFLQTNAQLKFISEAVQIDSSENTFINIPLQTNSKKVDVYINTDKPSLAYYKVKLLEVNGTNENANSLLLKLKLQAQELGFDGVIVLGINQYPYFNQNVVNTYSQTSDIFRNLDIYYRDHLTNKQSITAVGLKYKNNMQYVKKIIKKASIKLNDETKTEYNVFFQLNGTFSSINSRDANDFYLRQISLFKFSDYFLTEQKNFEQTITDNNLIVTSKLVTDSVNIHYTANYNESLKLQNVGIRIPVPNTFKANQYTVSYNIDSSGLIAKRFIFEGKKKVLLYTDVYLNDSNKRNYCVTRFDSANKEIFSVKFDFFKESDLPKTE